jgi:hypothetical protein
VRSRLDRELDAPSSKVPPRSRASRARCLHTCSPDRGIQCTDICRRPGQRRIHATTRLESCPSTVPPTPPMGPSPPLCDAVRHGRRQSRDIASSTPVRPTRHTLKRGRWSPRKGDGRLLHARTRLCRDVRPAGAVTSVATGPVRTSPPSQHHPGHCITISYTVGGDGGTRHRHAHRYASYGLPSAAPSNQCAGDHRTGDPCTATLEAAPGRIQGTP